MFSTKPSSYLHQDVSVRNSGLASNRELDPELDRPDQLRRLKLFIRHFTVFRHSPMSELFALQRQMTSRACRLQRHRRLLRRATA